MSLLSSLLKKRKLNSAIRQTEAARKSTGKNADMLFKEAYRSYQEAVVGDPLLVEALYNWGYALLHQTKTKDGADAIELLQEANDKFAFCMTVHPKHMGAAIDWGVALMELARARGVDAQDALYTMAQEKFLLAESIQDGCASYNLACLYSIRNEPESCQEALEKARDHGSLPDEQEIVSDSDLGNVQGEAWFAAFLETLQAPQVEETEQAEDASGEDETAPEAAQDREDAQDDAKKDPPDAAAKDS